MGVQEYLISARFMTTMGHFTALLLLFSTIENNINASFGDTFASSDKENAIQTTFVSITSCSNLQ